MMANGRSPLCHTPSRKVPASTTRRPAPARPSCSSTNSAATTAAGTTRCATSAAAGAASPGARAAIRPPTARTDEKLYGQDFFNRDAIAVLDAAAQQGAYRRPEHGRLHRADAGGQVSRARDLVHGGRRGLGRAEGARARSSSRSAASGRRRVRARRQDRRRSHGAQPDARAAAEQGPDRLAHVRGAVWPSIRPHAAAKTLRTVQAGRASLYDLEGELKGIKAPVLLLVGDEDEPCLDVNLWMKRLMPNARLGIPAGLRPRHQPGGAGAVQPADRAVHRRRGARQLAAARRTCHAGATVGRRAGPIRAPAAQDPMPIQCRRPARAGCRRSWRCSPRTGFLRNGVIQKPSTMASRTL